MGQTFSLARSNKFTIFLSPIVDADSLCGPKLAHLRLRYNVRRVDWYSIVNIEHGWVEVIRGITRNLLADVSDIRVVFSKARWRFLAGEEAFVAVRDGCWNHWSTWSDQLASVLNIYSIILVQTIIFYFAETLRNLGTKNEWKWARTRKEKKICFLSVKYIWQKTLFVLIGTEDGFFVKVFSKSYRKYWK